MKTIVCLDTPIEESYLISLNDVQGKCVFNSTLEVSQFDNKKFILNVTHLKEGVYFIQIRSKTISLPTKKFIKI
ncbi:MAG: T9SS type A sorting domain-containing protein [Saprospiraceae bacterium]|nr:T9SS type A sorting domain-containing protein [Saprospiraceae bacterium]